MLRLLAFICLFYCCNCATAQARKLIFDHYSTDQGFNTRTSRTVKKSSDGMIWITTDDGLVRYDSRKFKFYRHNPQDSLSVADNMTDQMVIDTKDNIWLVAGGGLDKFDMASGVFSHCFIRLDGKILKDFNPESLFFDPVYKKIWVSTWKGLYYSEHGSVELRKAIYDAASGETANMVFNEIAGDGKGNLWMCNTHGFYRYEPLNGHVRKFNLGRHPEKIQSNDGLFTLHIDGDQFWFGTWSKGLARYDLKLGKTTYYNYTNNLNEQNGVVAIASTGLPAEKDILWVSTVGYGLAAFNKKTGKFQFFSSVFENDKNGIKGKTNNLFPTQSEGMWIASENGLHRYDYKKQLFGEIELSRFNPLLKKAFPVEQLGFQKSTTGTDSLCWFTVPYVGTRIYDFKENKLRPPPAALKNYLASTVFTSYIDADQILWLSADKLGLVAYNLKKSKLIIAPEKYFHKKWEWVTVFFEDRKQQMWIATYKGLFLFNKEKQVPEPVEKINFLLQQKDQQRTIWGIDEDEQGRIWFIAGRQGEKGDMLGMYDQKSSELKLYYSDKDFPYNRKMNAIACYKSQVYLATNNGLIRFNGDTRHPSFSMLTVNEGLNNNYITDVLSDERSGIWCSTMFGVSCYITERNFFVNYTYSSSGLGPQKTPQLFRSRSGGYIYVCQQGALNYFHPDSLAIDPAPTVQFTSVQVFKKPFAESGTRLKTGHIFRLKHDQNMITVEFASLSFSNSKDNQYAYLLEGLEEKWNITKDNDATYSNLAPGKYTFKVKAANSSGVWAKEPVTLTFIIIAPFWKTGWFYTLMVLLVLIILYALYRNRINQLLHLQKIRSSISRNLHDEIGSTLTSISILSTVSQQAINKDPEQARAMLQKIASQSKNIQQNMSDIVWAIRNDTEKLESLFVRMREYATQTLEPLNINLNLQVNESLLEKTLSIEARKEILLIYKEAVNNITKHSGADTVDISFRQQNSKLVFVINDNGVWKGNGKTSGTGIGSMEQRAKAIGGTFEIQHAEKGTTLILRIPLT